ncbi:hypothetical protein [Maridesulfovibrio sp.]|uniref:hypothetical protein n=2 Tax=Maridesulfovibrio TaxID=2794998 RepID=UPI003B00C1B2
MDTKLSNTIVVFGMHRSGTSCIANILNEMGVRYCTDDDKAVAAAENRRGFWEHPLARCACDTLLQGSGNDWWAVRDFNTDSIPRLAKAQAREDVANLVKLLNTGGNWLVKEPRLCLVYPAWADLIPNPVGLMVWRDPIEVALSLRKRNGFSLDFGIALWELYTKSAFRVAADMPLVIVSFNELLATPEKVVAQLSQDFRNIGVQGIEPGTAASAIDMKLIHSSANKNMHCLLPNAVLEMIKALKAKEINSPVLRSELSTESALRLEDMESRESTRMTMQAQMTSVRKLEDEVRRGRDLHAREKEAMDRFAKEVRRVDLMHRMLDHRLKELKELEKKITDKLQGN